MYTCTLNNHKMFWRKRNHFEQNKKRYFSSYSLVSPFSRGFWKSKVEKYLRSVGKRRWHQDISWKNEFLLLQLARPLCQGCPECQQSWAVFAFCWQAKVILSTFQKKRKNIILIFFWKELYVIQLESWEEEVISTYFDQFGNELCQ